MTKCCFPKSISNTSFKKWNNANSMTFQNYNIENKYVSGSGVGARSRFVRSALLNRCSVNCCN